VATHVELLPANHSGVSGTATFAKADGGTMVTLEHTLLWRSDRDWRDRVVLLGAGWEQPVLPVPPARDALDVLVGSAMVFDFGGSERLGVIRADAYPLARGNEVRSHHGFRFLEPREVLAEGEGSKRRDTGGPGY
jgi:hypothetical protein